MPVVLSFTKLSQNGGSAILFAASNGHKQVVDLLVQRGVQVDAQDDKGWTALMHAAVYHHLDIVKTLVTKGKANLKMINKVRFSLSLGCLDLKFHFLSLLFSLSLSISIYLSVCLSGSSCREYVQH
jgi:ankyrin repeat protein